MHRLSSRRARPAIHACLALALSIIAGNTARADAVADFYKGRTLTIAVGHSVGGGYDLYARLLGPFLRKHIPGQPTVVIQTMTGAGGLRLVQYLYAAAPKDGSV